MKKSLMKIRIFHLYPEVLNLYGDIGNIICLKKRCEDRGIRVGVVNYGIRSRDRLNTGDIFFLGGGSDRSQDIVYSRLIKLGGALGDLIREGRVVLAICGGYQLLGRCYIDAEGREIPGLGVFDYATKSSRKRLIGNIVITNRLGLEPSTIVGFENHGGRTYHEMDPLGFVKSGFGNNGKDGREGLVYKNCIGTYLHGPLLPKNPHLADLLILNALRRKYEVDGLKAVNNDLELLAHEKVKKLYS